MPDPLRLLSGSKPFLGHLGAMANDRIRFMNNISAEVDRIARVRGLGRAPVVVVNHPESLAELLVEKHRDWDKSGMVRWALYPLAGEGLFTSRGELWRRQRRMMAPLFHPGRVATFADDMVECADRAIAEWGDGESRTLLRETTRITMSIAGKTLFHADTFSEADEIGHALTVALDFVADNSPSALSIGHILVNRFLRGAAKRLPRLEQAAQRFEQPMFVPGEGGRALRRAISFLDETVQKMIDQRRNEPGAHGDLLAKLLDARDEEDGARMSDKQVRDEILTLFVAGHETTATGLAWSMYLLCRNPSIYAAVEREIDSLPGPPTIADLPRLQLTLRVFKEALRLYPPVYLDGRQAMSDTTLQGIDLAEGTVALFSPYALHRRTDLWPDPERFDPDRFLPEQEARRGKLAWLPFGSGPRVCIGQGFALMEAQLVLARMIRQVRMELLADDEPATQATLRPRYGVRVRMRRRAHPSA